MQKELKKDIKKRINIFLEFIKFTLHKKAEKVIKEPSSQLLKKLYRNLQINSLHNQSN